MNFLTTGPRIDGACCSQLFSTASTGVNPVLLCQLIDDGLIMVDVVALIVNLAIPMQTEPVQNGKNLIGGFGNNAEMIQVIDAQQPLALLRSGVQVAGQRGVKRPQMQRAGWRGGEPADIGVGGSLGTQA